jgi:hypothetical protein
LIEQVIIPYKNKKIVDLGLDPELQYTILKHDLHFTHKHADVLALLEKNLIKAVFVPAACTDILQECDTCINKPFKVAVKDAFRNYLHNHFEEFKLANPNQAAQWKPDFKMSTLKPLITGWVLSGITRLKTEEMSQAIRTAFANDGCMTEIRSTRRRIDYLQKAMDLLQKKMDDLQAGIENPVAVDLITMIDQNEEFITQEDYDEEEQDFIEEN